MQDAKTCKRGAGLASFSGGRGSRRRQLGGQGETQGALRSLLRGRAEGLGGPLATAAAPGEARLARVSATSLLPGASRSRGRGPSSGGRTGPPRGTSLKAFVH